MAGMLMGAALLLSLLKGFHVVLVVHENVNMWEEGLLQEQAVVSTVVLMVIGPGTARLVTGRTNATAVEKGAILKEIARIARGVSGVREAIHGPHLHVVDGLAVGATAEAVVTADLGPDPIQNLPEGVALSVMRGDQGALATAGAPGDHSPQEARKWIAAPHLIAVGAPGDPSHL